MGRSRGAAATAALATALWALFPRPVDAQGPAAPAAPLQVELGSGARAVVQPPRVEVEGGLVARHDDVTIRAQRLEYDDERKEAVFSGGVVLERPGEVVRGERLTYRLAARQATVSQALVEVRAQGLDGPVFLKAGEVRARPERVEALGSELTTCPLPVERARYRVRVSRLEVVPGEWVRAYHAVLVDSGIPLFYWPYLSFSLKNPRAGRFGPPEVGWGEREGWFARTRIPYMGPGSSYGYVNVDYYERLGWGAGLYHALVDDGANRVAAYVHGIEPGDRRVPDLVAGAEWLAAAGGGQVQAGASAGMRDERGTVVRQANWSLSADAPSWGLSGSASGLARQRDGEGSAVGVASKGSLALAPRAAGPLSFSAASRWDVHTLKQVDPEATEIARALWDLDGRLGLSLSDRLRLELGAGRRTHPDLYADPRRYFDPDGPKWVAVTWLPLLSAEYVLARGQLGPAPVKLSLATSAGRWEEVRPSRLPQEADTPLLGGPGDGPRHSRLTGQARLEAGPVSVGGLEIRASGGLWGAGYDDGDAGFRDGHRQAEASASLQASLRPAPLVRLFGEYGLRRPASLPAWGPLQGGAGRWGSPFEFDRVEASEGVEVGVALGEDRPAGVSVRSRYDVLKGRWEELKVSAHAGRGSALSGEVVATRDLNDATWKSLVASVAVSAAPFRFEVSARYLPPEDALDRLAARLTVSLGRRVDLRAGAVYRGDVQEVDLADLELAVRVAPTWVVSAAASYDRSLGRGLAGLAHSRIGLTLDEDCRAVALSYEPRDRRFSLTYQIKAFPEALLATTGRPPAGIYEESRWQAIQVQLKEMP